MCNVLDDYKKSISDHFPGGEVVFLPPRWGLKGPGEGQVISQRAPEKVVAKVLRQSSVQMSIMSDTVIAFSSRVACGNVRRPSKLCDPLFLPAPHSKIDYLPRAKTFTT